MKAVVFDTFGGLEVLHLADVPLPDPGPEQVRIRVQARPPNAAWTCWVYELEKL